MADEASDQYGNLKRDDDFIASLPNHFKRIPDDVEAYVYDLPDDIAKDNIAKLFVRTENQREFKKAHNERGENISLEQSPTYRNDNVLSLKENEPIRLGDPSGEEGANVSVDSFKVGHGSFFYDHFIINNITYQSSQKVQIVQTFSDDFLYSFGENPIQANFSGVLLNTDNHRWRDHWIYAYDELLNAHDSIKNNIEVYLMFEGIVWKGRILDTSYNEKANRSRGINFNFTFYIQEKLTLKEKPPHETHDATIERGDSQGNSSQRLVNRIEDFKNIDIDPTDLDIVESSIREEAQAPEGSGHSETSNPIEDAIKNHDTNALIEAIIEEQDSDGDNAESIKDKMRTVFNGQNSTGDEMVKVKNNSLSAAEGEMNALTGIIKQFFDGIVSIHNDQTEDLKLRSYPPPFIVEDIKPVDSLIDADFQVTSPPTPPPDNTFFGIDEYESAVADLGSYLSSIDISEPVSSNTANYIASVFAAESNNWLTENFDDNNIEGKFKDYILSNNIQPGLNFTSGHLDFSQEVSEKILDNIGLTNSIYSNRTASSTSLEANSPDITKSVYPKRVKTEESIDKLGRDEDDNKIETDNSLLSFNFRSGDPSWPTYMEIAIYDPDDSEIGRLKLGFYKKLASESIKNNDSIKEKVDGVRKEIETITDPRLDGTSENGDDNLKANYQLSLDSLNNWFTEDFIA